MMRDAVPQASDALELATDPDAPWLASYCPGKCSVESLFPQQNLTRIGTSLLWTLRGRHQA